MIKDTKLGKRKRQLLFLALMCAGTILVTAATGVTNQLRTRPEQREIAMSQMRRWSGSLALDVPAGQYPEWLETATRNPQLFLTACTAAERPASSVNESTKLNP